MQATHVIILPWGLFFHSINVRDEIRPVMGIAAWTFEFQFLRHKKKLFKHVQYHRSANC